VTLWSCQVELHFKELFPRVHLCDFFDNKIMGEIPIKRMAKKSTKQVSSVCLIWYILYNIDFTKYLKYKSILF
jgi:hypothetical protein